LQFAIVLQKAEKSRSGVKTRFGLNQQNNSLQVYLRFCQARRSLLYLLLYLVRPVISSTRSFSTVIMDNDNTFIRFSRSVRLANITRAGAIRRTGFRDEYEDSTTMSLMLLLRWPNVSTCIGK